MADLCAFEMGEELISIYIEREVPCFYSSCGFPGGINDEDIFDFF